ncbi:MAG: TIGR03032 family protein [Planctomycetia bacterium]
MSDGRAETAGSTTREVKYEHSAGMAPLLAELGCTLLVSTYQAGKLVCAAPHDGGMALTFHSFDRPMGMAVRADKIAVGTREHIWTLANRPDLARRLDPPGTYDACFLTRSAVATGDVQCHEMEWAGDELWVVNTLFSCLCTVHEEYSFVPRWRPPFVTALAAEDRCHLNGMTLEGGRPKYVTAMAESDTPQGWRPNKVSTGCVIDVDSGETVLRGLAMPHSPTWHQGYLWLLDSGRGRLVQADLAGGAARPVCDLPGYTRGLAMHGKYAFVGLSKIRETSTFGGVPIAEYRDQLRCAVIAVDLTTGTPVARMEFVSGIDEIFDVKLLPGTRRAAVAGPSAHLDGERTIWVVPEPGREPPLAPPR